MDASAPERPPEAAPPTLRRGPPPEAIARTVAWASGVFSEYYRRRPPPMPSRHGRREFGFIPAPRPPPDRTPFFRHMAIRSREELQDYLVRQAPWHCYYSTAYYENPAGATMREKDWLGADLIFDLDADHLRGAAGMSFEEQLAAVKTQTIRLVEEFLLPDFGFDPAHVRIVFSGGRGYHVHVTDPRVLGLGSPERRDVVDYISPPDGVLEPLLEKMTTYHAYTRNEVTRAPVADRLIPRVDEGGWRGRYTKYLVEWLREIASLPLAEAMARLEEIPGIGPKKAAEIHEDLTPDRLERVAAGKIEAAPGLRRHLKALDAAFRARFIRFAPGETDEPVTADVKRLIRLPGSLHGKTGLRVTPVPLDALRGFDPLRDAVALPDDPVRILVAQPERVRLGDETITPGVGAAEVPLRHAAFLVLRRKALLAHTDRP